jgi:hypothetical protein
VTAAADPFARLDELTQITLRFEGEMAGRAADVERLAQGHGRAMDARTAEIGRLRAEGLTAAEIGEHLDGLEAEH